MEKIKITKGFKTKLVGMTDTSVIHRPAQETVAVSVEDIPHIRPKLLVREGDPVKTGTPLLTDKRDMSIQYVSPGTGRVKKILYGERRRLLEVIIKLDPGDEFIEFESVTALGLKEMSNELLVEHLKKGGLWQCFRQLPFKDTADSSKAPPMIIVSLNGNDLFSPHPGVMLKNRTADFKFGLEVLKRFSDRILVTAREGKLDGLDSVKPMITHHVPDIYPAWDPAVVLYHIKEGQEENMAWFISLDHLLMVSRFLFTGKYPVEKIVAVTQGQDRKPHILTRQGAPVGMLTGGGGDGALVATGQFNGRKVALTKHLGFFENTLNVIPGVKEDELFGFIQPGLDTPTVSKTFLSCLFDKPRDVDCTLHGEERACINCSYCENICPNDLMPNFILKALLVDDIEEALAFGLLDCCRCGLCSFACPSKIELARSLSDGIDAYYKDKS